MAEKYVLTGGPNSGKTTTLNALKKEGFNTFDEAARIILEDEMKKGKEVITYKGNVDARQKKILQQQLKNEERAESLKGAVFFDRGIPDGIIYYRLSKTKIPRSILSEAKKDKRSYKKVFIFDMLPYKTDDVRKEPEEIAMKIHEMVCEVYSELGYEIIKVPVMPVEDRVSFIKQKIL
ncbi:ATP-binding protein [Candidatus Pacearchaeota archaeon]|nr:ATP-binding protein [Candidatus Pacearchaeota archaeon]